MTKLLTFLSPHGLSSDEKNENDECKLERAAQIEIPSKMKGLGVLRKKSFDVSAFANLCGEASVLLLLLRLSNFLREAYSGVTTTRLLEYLPGEKERVADRGVTRVSNIEPFNSYIPHETHVRGKVGRSATTSVLDNSIRQYAEFRRLMRENDEKMSIHSGDDSSSRAVDASSQQLGNKRKRSQCDSGSDD